MPAGGNVGGFGSGLWVIGKETFSFDGQAYCFAWVALQGAVQTESGATGGGSSDPSQV
jgi:hypothetical protein